jgi:hypothetical protein
MKPSSPRAAHLLATLLLCAVGLSACAQQKTLYDWGSYEKLVYEMYASPGKAEPGTQIAKLTEDVERINAEGRHVAPGVHAHLGYLYYTQGQPALAKEEFAIEKQLFPESTVFIDGLLARMQQPGTLQQ